MKSYYKVMPGIKSRHVEECVNENFIGEYYGIHMNLNTKLPEKWQDFNHTFIPVYLADNPGKSKVAAGLVCYSLI